jgi:glycosyltransferase involved in cell wall biosynthesis
VLKDSAPLVSVVTPVYNGESYLRQCVESVLAQTYGNWDYTIVNNCSTDATLEIAREYAARDARIHVHNNDTFVRVIQNYNIAVRQASPSSEYCKVVAADDWLFPECLQRMVALGEECRNVGIIGAYQLCGTRVEWQGLEISEKVVSGRDAGRRELLGGPYVIGTPTTVMFRSSLIRSRPSFFNESNFHADTEACVESFERCDFGFIHQVLTYGRVAKDSLTSFSQRYNTYSVNNLHMLKHHGAKYLTETELRRRLQNVRANYLEYLGKQVWKQREPEFWAYHRSKMAELGYPLTRMTLVGAAARVGLDLLLNPKRSLQKAFQTDHPSFR